MFRYKVSPWQNGRLNHSNMTGKFFVWCFCLIGMLAVPATAQKGKAPLKKLYVDKVWSGHPVGFDLLTTEKYQYAAYYNADRQMIIARRALDSDQWQKTALPTAVGWDSHNYVTLAVDREGYIHVSGNMHVVPLIYFRSTRPWEIDQFEKLPMTGENEDRVTYPVFFKDQEGSLYFQYRNGGSGDGITYWNRYDEKSRKWESLYGTSIFDGEKEANAYMINPVLGPDGYFYMVWMWRLTPVANTNHNLSCMRSRDLKNWENMRGEKVNIPVKWSDDVTIVDPVGPWNGLINMGFNISWDNDKTPYITYHKFDDRGISQVFIARWEGTPQKKWMIRQISDWAEYKWDLNRRGSLTGEVSISKIREVDSNRLSVGFTHSQYGKGTWILDKSTLRRLEEIKAGKKEEPAVLPALVVREGMGERQRSDNTGRFTLQWQTLPANQDRPRPGPAPDPVDLILYQIK